MMSKKLKCIGLIMFGVAICSSLVAQAQDSTSVTRPVTLTMTLKDPLTLDYNPGQIELNPGGTPGIYSSNPDRDERSDSHPISITSLFQKWQLDVSMSNGGRLSAASQSTVNMLMIYLFGANDINEQNPVKISNWQSTGVNPGDVSANMWLEEDSDPSVQYTYYARYDLQIDPDDLPGSYTGQVIWTLSSPL